MAEWLKAHAWKACERGDSFRRFESSRFRHFLSKFAFFLTHSIKNSVSFGENVNLLQKSNEKTFRSYFVLMGERMRTVGSTGRRSEYIPKV